MIIDIWEQRWTSLLTMLHERTRTGGMWKNCDAALSGVGDVDYATSKCEWNIVRETFEEWRVGHGLASAFACEHRPGALYLVAFGGEDAGSLWQLDVRDRVTVRGATLFSAGAIQGQMIDNPRGFRQLRPGCEAAFKLILKCAGPTGELVPRLVVEEEVAELIRSDPDGFRASATFFGSTAGVIQRIGDQVAEGAVSGDLSPVFRQFRRSSFREPSVVLKAAVHRTLTSRTCPLLNPSSTSDSEAARRRLLAAHDAVWALT